MIPDERPEQAGKEVSEDTDVTGNGPFWKWFISIWPEIPIKRRAQRSNWRFKCNMVHAGWCAAERTLRTENRLLRERCEKAEADLAARTKERDELETQNTKLREDLLDALPGD